jgi:hypothetical protein
VLLPVACAVVRLVPTAGNWHFEHDALKHAEATIAAAAITADEARGMQDATACSNRVPVLTSSCRRSMVSLSLVTLVRALLMISFFLLPARAAVPAAPGVAAAPPEVGRVLFFVA